MIVVSVAVAQQIADLGQCNLRFGSCVGVTCRQKDSVRVIYFYCDEWEVLTRQSVQLALSDQIKSLLSVKILWSFFYILTFSTLWNNMQAERNRGDERLKIRLF